MTVCFPEAKGNQFLPTDFLEFLEIFGEQAPKRCLYFMPICTGWNTKSL